MRRQLAAVTRRRQASRGWAQERGPAGGREAAVEEERERRGGQRRPGGQAVVASRPGGLGARPKQGPVEEGVSRSAGRYVRTGNKHPVNPGSALCSKTRVGGALPGALQNAFTRPGPQLRGGLRV